MCHLMMSLYIVWDLPGFVFNLWIQNLIILWPKISMTDWRACVVINNNNNSIIFAVVVQCYPCCCCLMLGAATWQKDHIPAHQRYEMSFLLMVLWTITWNLKFIANLFVEIIDIPSLVSSAFWIIRITPVEQNVTQEKRIKNSKWKR